MGVQRFEDLRVWQEARLFADEIGALIAANVFARDPELKSQLNAAVISVVANIAEGFTRGRRKEFQQFSRIAAASNGESRSLLYVAAGRQYIDPDTLQRLVHRSEGIARMLRKLIAALDTPLA
jgi:four helix bundle protein